MTAAGRPSDRGARRRRGIADEPPPGRDAAHDRFAHAELAELTIGMATAGSWPTAIPDEWVATMAIARSLSNTSPLAEQSGHDIDVDAAVARYPSRT